MLRLENALYSLGFFSGMADEEFDENTLSGLKLFQEANGLEISGSLDSHTREMLYGDGNKTDYTQFKYACMDKHLRMGDSGYAVKLLTLQLKKLGYPIDVTDIFDEQTLETLLKFQKANGFTVDGVWDIVYTVLAHNSLLKSAEDYDSFTTESTISEGYEAGYAVLYNDRYEKRQYGGIERLVANISVFYSFQEVHKLLLNIMCVF